MAYIGLNTQYRQTDPVQLMPRGCQCHQQQSCCHIVPPTLEVQDVNYEIVREREELRVRIAQLEQNHMQELDILKNNIIAECETTLEKEIRDQELSYENKISMLNQRIDSLTKKTIQQETIIATLQKEAKEQEEANKALNTKFIRSKKTIADWETKFNATVKDMNEAFEAKLKKDLVEQELMLNNSFDRERNRLLAQIEDLKNKITEFQIRMKQVAAELEKIRAELQAKKIAVEEWRFKFESLEKSSEIEIYQIRKELENLQRQPPQRNLQFEVKELRDKLDRKKQKLVKLRDEVRVKTETIVVEKPVEVEKIIEIIKYVPVEKIVKEIQNPKQPIVIQECGVADKSETVIREYQHEIEEKERTIERLSSELEEITIQLRESKQSYQVLSQDCQFLSQDRDNLNVQVSNYAQHVKQLEAAYSLKNQELVAKIQQLYQQITLSARNPGKIIVRVGKDGKSTVEQG